MNNTPYDEWRKTATPAAGGAGVPPDRYMEKLFDRAVSQMNDSVWKFADGQGGCKFLTAKGPASTVAEMPRSIIVTLRPAYGGKLATKLPDVEVYPETKLLRDTLNNLERFQLFMETHQIGRDLAPSAFAAAFVNVRVLQTALEANPHMDMEALAQQVGDHLSNERLIREFIWHVRHPTHVVGESFDTLVHRAFYDWFRVSSVVTESEVVSYLLGMAFPKISGWLDGHPEIISRLKETSVGHCTWLNIAQLQFEHHQITQQLSHARAAPKPPRHEEGASKGGKRAKDAHNPKRRQDHIKCFKCHKYGHKAEDCPQSKRDRDDDGDGGQGGSGSKRVNAPWKSGNPKSSSAVAGGNSNTKSQSGGGGGKPKSTANAATQSEHWFAFNKARASGSEQLIDAGPGEMGLSSVFTPSVTMETEGEPSLLAMLMSERPKLYANLTWNEGGEASPPSPTPKQEEGPGPPLPRHDAVTTARILVHGQLRPAYIDTGASHAFVTLKSVSDLGAEWKRYDEPARVEALAGQGFRAFGECTLQVRIGNSEPKDLLFYVVEDGQNSPASGEIVIGKETIHDVGTFLGRNKSGDKILSMGNTLFYRGQDGVYTPAVIDLREVTGIIASPESEPELSLRVEDSLPVMTTTRGPRRPRADASAESSQGHGVFEVPETELRLHFVAYDAAVAPPMERVGEPPEDLVQKLSPEAVGILRSVQNSLIELSEIPLADVEVPPEFHFTIELKDDAPSTLRETQHVTGKKNEELFREYIKAQLGTVIEMVPPGEVIRYLTNHCFPTNEVKTRVCIVARLLNKWAKTIPIHRQSVQECRAKVSAGSAMVFSSLDIRWAFNIIPIAEESRQYTTFYGPDGQFYRYIRMTFGFKNAPAAWERYIRYILSDLLHDICILFVDDLLIFSPSLDQHVRDLKRVIDRLHQHGIPVRWQKAKLLREEIEYIGWTWKSGGLIDPTNVSVRNVVDFKTPTCAEDILSFCGVAQWIADSVQELARPLAVLRPLGKKLTKWNFTGEHEAAFNAAKTLCAEYFTTSLVDWESEDPLRLYSDASDWGCGAALFQGDRLIMIYSYAFNRAQQAWSTINQEAFGIVKALGHWNYILLGIYFQLYTDHRPLIYLINALTSGKGSAMNERWLITLRSYDMDVFHVPGTMMRKYLADILSRPPFVKPPGDFRRNKLADMTAMFTEIRSHDLDVFYRACAAFAEEGELPDDIKDSEEFQKQETAFNRIKSLLYLDRGQVRMRGENGWDSVVVLPASETRVVFQNLHSESFSGHFAKDRTIKRIAERYFWPSLREDVGRWISECEECQKGNLQATARTKLLVREPATVWQCLYYDVIDMPLATDGSQYRYLLIIRDSGSRFTVLWPLESKEVQPIIRALSLIFGIIGNPENFFSDAGSEVSNADIVSFCRQRGIVAGEAAPKAHQSNGVVERAVKEVRAYERRFNTGSNWPSFIGDMMYALNTVPSRATGFSPAELMFGRSWSFPGDAEHGIMHKPKFYGDWLQRLRDMRELALTNDANYRAKMVQYYAKRHPGAPKEELKVGDEVLYADLEDPSQKHRPRAGPFKVVSVANDGLRVTVDVGEKLLTRPADYFVKFRRAEPLSAGESETSERVPSEEAPSRVETIPVVESTLSENFHPVIDTPGPDSYGEYEIEKIVGARGAKGSSRFYRIKYKGYSDKDNTWEPAKNVSAQLAQAFDATVDDNLSTNIVQFLPHSDEVAEVLALKTRRCEEGHQRPRSEPRVLWIRFHGDVQNLTMRLDFSLTPEGIFNKKDIWQSSEAREAAEAAYVRWRQEHP